jgi:hypothetical protein
VKPSDKPSGESRVGTGKLPQQEVPVVSGGNKFAGKKGYPKPGK